MNLDELQSVQARERQSSDLQHLRASFYREVGEFIQGLTRERADAVAGADDPFSDPDVRRLSDDIETAEQTVEAIYERRVGKVVKKASIAAAGMPVDVDGLTDEEAALFEDLVERIERNRESVLRTLEGEAAQVSPALEERPPGTGADAPTDDAPNADAPDGTDEAGVTAADLMGEDPSAETDAESSDTPPASGRSEPPVPDPDELRAGDAVSDPADGGTATGTDEDGGGSVEAPAGDAGDASGTEPPTDDDAVAGIPRTTVRITADVGEVVGADDRDYDLSTDDVVTLPTPNADVLVDKDAAERLPEE